MNYPEDGRILIIRNAAEHNLCGISLDIPHNTLVVITGVSGSGKSTLAFDVIYAECRYRYLETLSGHNRRLFHKMRRPSVGALTGLRPAIAVDQKTISPGPRSTVGTLSELFDYLRLLYARTGKPLNPGTELSRSLFSFNTPKGACHTCKGLGVAEHIDPEMLISDPNLTLRQGALKITTPNGYIIYSQVTMEVLQQVCVSEGFTVDIPWNRLTPEQQHIVLYGSEKIRIPYGKHTLESRMKWKGITVKPREEGFYKGIVPVMEDILGRDRNDNILRFARVYQCPACGGSRLSAEARSVYWNGFTIAEVADMTVAELHRMFDGYHPSHRDNAVWEEIRDNVMKRTGLLMDLGLGYLTLSRGSATLSGGEAQRIRLATQAASGLKGVVYVLDEPTAGLHPADSLKLAGVLVSLRNAGNTVIVVEHDPLIIRQADFVVDIGPGAGDNGGQLLFSGPLQQYLASHIPDSPTWLMLHRPLKPLLKSASADGSYFRFAGISKNNLNQVEFCLLQHSLNVVTGVSGAGKSSLMQAVEEKVAAVRKMYPFSRIVTLDQKPIGRTPRSNAATYTKVFDAIRKLYGNLQAAREAGFSASDFSFNTGNGRCTTCDGAGTLPIGMHFMGNVEIPCETCHGKRFIPEVLEITWQGYSIRDVLEMRITEAAHVFRSEKSIFGTLSLLDALGLGYLILGQPATTLSGGEAQRIRIAAELASVSKEETLYLLDEPTTGLHHADVERLMKALRNLIGNRNTVVCTDHHDLVISEADHLVDLGPGSGAEGGRILFAGPPALLPSVHESVTGQHLASGLMYPARYEEVKPSEGIIFRQVETHNLRNISFHIPHRSITLVTGVSGSGKSSLAFDTLYAECHRRFTENFSTYIRAQLPQLPGGDFASCEGITPAIAIDQRPLSGNPRSTVGTYSGIHDLLRLLYSRVAQLTTGNAEIFSSLFSFNHQDGACQACKGLGESLSADPDRLITHPERSLLNGAMDGSRAGRFYGDPQGQYMAILRAVAMDAGFNPELPWQQLSDEAQKIVMEGTGNRRYEVSWSYKRGNREGTYRFGKEWPGIMALVNEEYDRKHADKRAETLLPLMRTLPCPECRGSRLRAEAMMHRVKGLNIHQAGELELRDFAAWLSLSADDKITTPFTSLIQALQEKTQHLTDLTLGYLTLNRPTATLSGGERQRLKLAVVLGSTFTGITVILDEPAAGLHPADRHQIISKIQSLRDQGNTLVVIEHQHDFLAVSDYVIELGPGAGRDGGNLLFSGTAQAYRESGTPLSNAIQANLPHSAVEDGNIKPLIRLEGAFARNLKGFSLEIPAGRLTCVEGVSGSGKSTLLQEVLYPSVLRHKATGCKRMELYTPCEVIWCNPADRAKTGSGTLLTLTGLAEPVRKWFASGAKAKEDGIRESWFSLHHPGGRCEHCKGEGEITISMDFLPDVSLPCEQCRGQRIRPEAMQYLVSGLHFGEMLQLTLNELLALAEKSDTKEAAKIRSASGILQQTGLGHLVLGQKIRSLSGGEWQRLQLALALTEMQQSNTLFLLDEPSRGLSAPDVHVLARLFQRLAGEGHTLVYTDHNPFLIHQAHYNITLGPEGGIKGGYLLNL